jgi:hypothetical protein
VLAAKGFKTALSALTTLVHNNFRRSLADKEAHCWLCGQPIPLRIRYFEAGKLSPRPGYGMVAYCEACRNSSTMSLSEFALGLPDGMRFWRNHPRLRALPEQRIEVDGHSAIVTGHESLADAARYETVFAYDTFTALATRIKM